MSWLHIIVTSFATARAPEVAFQTTSAFTLTVALAYLPSGGGVLGFDFLSSTTTCSLVFPVSLAFGAVAASFVRLHSSFLLWPISHLVSCGEALWSIKPLWLNIRAFDAVRTMAPAGCPWELHQSRLTANLITQWKLFCQRCIVLLVDNTKALDQRNVWCAGHHYSLNKLIPGLSLKLGHSPHGMLTILTLILESLPSVKKV